MYERLRAEWLRHSSKFLRYALSPMPKNVPETKVEGSKLVEIVKIRKKIF